MPEMLSREQLEALKGHTQGPWEVFPKLKYNEWHVGVPMEGTQMRLGLFADGVPGNNPEPDPRLIAAAPDLLNTALALPAPSTEAIAPEIREYCGDNAVRHGEPIRVLMRGMGSFGLRVVVYETAALTLGMCGEALFERNTRPVIPAPAEEA